MDDDKLSAKVRQELEEITRRKGYLLESKKTGDQNSLKIIDQFLKCNRESIEVNKNLIATLLLISNHLISESVRQLLKDLNLKEENTTVLQLYLYLQMTSNFLDGFLLGHAFIKVIEGKDILQQKDMDILEIFKRIYVIRMRHREPTLIRLIDEETGLIDHFEKAYRELFLSNSSLLKDLAKENINLVVKYLILTFFDGILTAKIISDNPERPAQE